MTLAWVFPGQGSQRVGMGRELAQAFPAAREAFDEADEALDGLISKLCFDGPSEELQLTANTQPAILTASVAAARALAVYGCRTAWLAGHSLGEYSAVVAGGGLTLTDAVRIVRRRGQYMQEAVPVGVGAMSAIVGIDLAPVEEACRQAALGEVVAPANINGPGQVVIAGHVAAVARAEVLCKAAGARRVVRLPVSAPFHCELMRQAQERLAVDLDQAAFQPLAATLVNNVDAAPVREAAVCRDGFRRQVSAPVRWQEVVERMVREGVDTFVELGPGTVLSGLVRKIAKGVTVLNVEDAESLELTIKALGNGGAQ